MKRLLITLSVIGCLLYADPSPVGNWKLSGLKVDYLHIARETTEIALNDVYGAGVRVVVATVPKGSVYTRFTNGPFTLPIIDAAQLNLNVNLYPDGTGAIAEGSFYPDIDLIPGTCITSPQVFPVTDEFVWEVGSEMIFSTTNIIGIPGLNDKSGSQAYGFGLSESGTFDGWPAAPLMEKVPAGLDGIGTADGTLAYSCGAWCFGTDGTDGGAAAAFGGDVELCATTCSGWDHATATAYSGGGLVPGWLAGSGSSGMFAKDQGNSQMGQDLNVDFLLEWNAIDGVTSASGIDLDDEDGDGDNTEYNRIFGYPYLEATTIDNTNPLCDITGGALAGGTGLNYPVAGDVVAALGGEAAVGALITGKCLQGTVDGAYDSCIGQVYDGVMGQCEAAGGPVPAVTGLCVEASQGEAFAGACSELGAGFAVGATCLQLGFSSDICDAAGQQGVDGVEAYCDSQADFNADGEVYGDNSCADIGVDPCTVLVDVTFATGLCGGLAGSLVTSETCTEWTDSFYDYDEAEFLADGTDNPNYGDVIGESFFDASAAGVIGASCTDFSAGLATGLAAGDPTTIATIDGLFAGVAGIGCSDYGAAYTVPVEDGGLGCVVEVANANDMYLMDPTLTTWGLVLTYNAASVQQYMAAGYTTEALMASFPELFVNDSGWDFDASCYATGEACSGRLVMNFEPTCIPELEARQIVAEFVDLDDLCESSGDANGDGETNVVDIVRIVDHILGGDQLGGLLGCQADINGDGIINVVDVVAIVGGILGRTVVENDATTATLSLKNNQISIEADGYISGVELVVEFNGNLDIDFANNYIADYSVDGNTAHILLVSVDNVREVLTVNSGTITSIVEAIVVNSSHALETSSITIEEPTTYIVGKAFPNPFNPSTNISLELNTSADVSVKVYNLMGQLVSVIAEGAYSPATYNWTWNADNLASGAYLVKTQVGSDVNTQKVMLVK